MANQDNNRKAVNVRKISKDEFKKIYFEASEEPVALASDLNANSTDATVVVDEPAIDPATDKKVKKVVTARKDMTMAQWTIKEMKRNKVGYFMIAPFMFVFTLFTLFPVLLSFALSFTSFNMLEFRSDMFVGISNYTRLFFDDDIFLQACKNTLVFAMVTGPVSYILSLDRKSTL